MKYILIGVVIMFLYSDIVANEVDEIQVVELVKSDKSWDQQILPEYPQGQPEITVLRITIPAGKELPVHMHPFINAGVLLKGELSVTTENGDTFQLKVGDPIVEVVNTWHYGKNEGDEPLEIIVFYAGIVDEEITIKQVK